MHIKISKGLDIPIKGKPQGPISPLVPSGSAGEAESTLIALNLKTFEGTKFKVLCTVGEIVKIGQPLAEDKSTEGRFFCSPAGGKIKEIRRGLQRALQYIVIEPDKKEEYFSFPVVDVANASKEQIIEAMMKGGVFSQIRSRPFNILADPQKTPRSIFVKGIESAPLLPPAEMQVEGHEKEFQAGLDALAKLTSGKVHLVYSSKTHFRPFLEAKNVSHHTAEGPHPIANQSLHIQNISPIHSADDAIWTLNAHDVVCIGYLLTKGQRFIERVVSIAGPGVLPERIGFFKTREGVSVATLMSGRISRKKSVRMVSGDPLIGKKVEMDDFLGFSHFAFCIIPESQHREFLHFFRLGTDKYTFSRAYLTGHLNNAEREYDFTTNQHGEHRPFIDASLYNKVMPLPISTMHLVKAVLAEDYELAEKLGLLSVDSEDFALPTFVCPSKMEMTEIMKDGLKHYAHDVLQ